MVTFGIKHIGNRKLFLKHRSPPPSPNLSFCTYVCTHILHNICEKPAGTQGERYPTAQNVVSGQARISAFGFLLCSLENLFFFRIIEIISTSKLPFYNPLVMKYYNVLAYFS